MSQEAFIFLFAIVGALCIGSFIGRFLGNFLSKAISQHFDNKDFIAHE